MRFLCSKIIGICLFFFSTQLYAFEKQSACKQESGIEIVEMEIRGKKQNEPMDKQTKEIIGRIKAIVERFFTLVEDPDNKHNVASSVTQIVANAAELVIAATKTHNFQEVTTQEAPEESITT